MKQLDLKMRDRLEWCDVKLLLVFCFSLILKGGKLSRAVLTLVLSDSDDSEEDNLDGIKSAMESITSAFRAPLEDKGVNLSSLHDKIEEKLSTMQEGTSQGMLSESLV